MAHHNLDSLLAALSMSAYIGKVGWKNIHSDRVYEIAKEWGVSDETYNEMNKRYDYIYAVFEDEAAAAMAAAQVVILPSDYEDDEE